MTKRSKIKNSYVQRRKDGTFKEFARIGRSLSIDRRKKAKRVKSGYGFRGDVY